MIVQLRSAGFCLLLTLGAAPALADDIPAYEVLTCEKDCPPHTAAKLLDQPGVSYPQRYTGRDGTYVEAMVDIDYTIGTDGSVKDAVVETLLGPQEFADNALRAVNGRKYQPATEGDKPVEESHRVRFMFRMRFASPGGRPAMVRDYRKAVDLAKDNKLAEAIAGLRDIAARPELNFYERTMNGYALALLEVQAGDPFSARDAVRVATIDKGAFLDPRSQTEALRLRIRLEAATGEFAESFAWFDILNAKEPLPPDDPEVLLIAKLHAAIAAPQPLAIPARIPQDATRTFWQHTLLRRGFEFHDVVGKLDSFVLRCQRHGIRSAVSDKADWTVPASWSGCFINVSGTPGTTFNFVDFAPAIPGVVRPAEP